VIRHLITFAVRRILRSPRELPAIVVTLSIGVGAVAAGFAVLRAVLLAPLPYRDPGRLVRIWDAAGYPGLRALSARQLETLATAPFLEGTAAYAGIEQNLTVHPDVAPRRAYGRWVTPAFFDVLGVHARVGRTFTAADEPRASPLPIVISERLPRAGLIRGEVGETVYLDGVRYVVIGIMADSFWFPDKITDYWIPLLASRAGWNAPIVARVRSVESLAALEGQLNAVLSTPKQRSAIRARTLDAEVNEAVWTPVIVLQLAAALVLVLSVVNATWLFLTRARRSAHEFAILEALGATPAMVRGTWFIEVALVGLAALPLAAVMSWLALALTRTASTLDTPRLLDATFSAELILVGGLTSVIVAMLAGTPAAFRIGRSLIASGVLGAEAVSQALRPHRQRSYIRTVCMCLQAATVFALAVQAMMLLLGLYRLMAANVGFTNLALVSAHVSVPPSPSGIDTPVFRARQEELLKHLKARGVDAALTSALPLGDRELLTTARLYPSGGRPITRMVRLRTTTPSYFVLSGIRMVEGRAPFASDEGHQRLVINAELARRMFGGAAVGRRIEVSGSEWEIIGVTEDIRHRSLLEDVQPEAIMLYADIAQLSAVSSYAALEHFFVVADARDGSGRVLDTVRETLRSEWPDATITELQSFADRVWLATGERRFVALGAGIFASIAVLLVTLGFQGMVSYGLALRGRELGVRLALGATTRHVLLESLKPVLIVYACGVTIGVLFATVGGRLVQSQVVVPAQATRTDFLFVTGAAALLLAVVVGVASYRPVGRAIRVDVSRTLRTE
jgi:putative ABC transport system permease protein